MELAPPEATAKRGKEEVRLPVEEIAVGEVIIVKPGERIVMDGVIRSGASAINEATITGESIPVEKTDGDAVYAGTLLANGALFLLSLVLGMGNLWLAVLPTWGASLLVTLNGMRLMRRV